MATNFNVSIFSDSTDELSQILNLSGVKACTTCQPTSVVALGEDETDFDYGMVEYKNSNNDEYSIKPLVKGTTLKNNITNNYGDNPLMDGEVSEDSIQLLKNPNEKSSDDIAEILKKVKTDGFDVISYDEVILLGKTFVKMLENDNTDAFAALHAIYNHKKISLMDEYAAYLTK